MALFSDAGVEFLLRWLHFLSGITWIGLLYYFNFVQGPFFAETDAATRSNATQKLVPRALWWFRWSAVITFLSGGTIIVKRWTAAPPDVSVAGSPWGVAILSGALLGTVMLANVWRVIWPNQKIVIAAASGQANPAAAAAGRRAFLASRTNVVLSIPMLFFMGAATHMPPHVAPSHAAYWIALFIVVALIEANALMATKGPTTQPIEKVSGVIITGFVVWAVLYGLVQFLLAG